MPIGPKIVMHEGDNIDILPTITDASIDAVITDPPYNLGFMGKSWDKNTVAFYPEFWEEVMRTMKPGAHLLAFGGSRTYHRMACAIEDAGFEIRDTLCWLYGTGFPKSLDVSKAVDKAAGAVREVVGQYQSPENTSGQSNHIERIGTSTSIGGLPDITAPATPEAAQWQGWGTALKPAFEPIIVARKPFPGTVAGNVLAHGTGALNIDACRVPSAKPGTTRGAGGQHGALQGRIVDDGLGRHPANVLHDGSDEVEAAFAAFGEKTSNSGNLTHKSGAGQIYGKYGATPTSGISDSGTASRFFYSAKATDEDRRNSKHPTVKPIALMRWLCNLVTPPRGTILDCFAGTGSTLLAARNMNFDAIGIEKEPEYVRDFYNRLNQSGFF